MTPDPIQIVNPHPPEPFTPRTTSTLFALLFGASAAMLGLRIPTKSVVPRETTPEEQQRGYRLDRSTPIDTIHARLNAKHAGCTGKRRQRRERGKRLAGLRP